jgi:hypothetical protein
MHHIEGALCGLPLFYIESGALPEYCDGFGISFTPQNFEQKLQEMIKNFDHWTKIMPFYPHTADKMCSEYFSLFDNLMENKEKILARRKLFLKTGFSKKTLYYLKNITKGIKTSAKMILEQK